jgi:glyoxylase-like metal-dependent hydrolase (beta-lactamase superfamily II)
MDTIISGVHRVSGGYVNSYIVDGDEGVTLVDTLLPKKEGTIAKALAEIGRTLQDVSAIVLTHAHADHSGSAAAIQAISEAEVYVSAGDASAVRGEERPPPPPMADRFPFLKPIMRLFPAPAPVIVEHVIGEGIGGRLPSDLQVVDTPGHTPGHVSFLLERDGGLLFVGDAAVAKKGEVKRGWMNRAEPTFDASLSHIAELDFERAVFGHAAPLQSGAAAAFRRFVDSIGRGSVS